MPFRDTLSEILSIYIINNEFISIDIWSLVHFLSGVTLSALLIKLDYKKKYIIIFTMLPLWEIFEFVNYGLIKTDLFYPENLANVIWDILVGIIGVGFIDIIYRLKR